jgi:phenylalanine-4-hydroxylase
MNTTATQTTSPVKDWERPIEWFINRVGQTVYRAPFFDFEKNRKEPIKQVIKSHEHAEMLFELQRPSRPLWYDNQTDVKS